ncbi:MAG: MFS transporter [Oleiphilaceae bacterium]|nr:MFS transporter [Oleiphilaceae bacterium]
MKGTALSLSALIASIILLISGNAFLMTLLGLRLSIEGFSASLIGWILVFYSVGFVLGTLYAGTIIQRVGHIRAFAVFAALLAVAILLHPLAVQAGLWGLLRVLSGFVMAGLMIVMESWFSSKADNQNRASLFAIYQIVFFLSTAGGQVLIRVGDPAGFAPFTLAAVLVILALIPLSLTRTQSPVIEQGSRMSLANLYRTSPVGTLGALTAGLLISAFYTMGPVYAERIGLDLGQISNFMAAAIITAMVLAWPVGRFCDHFNRYQVLQMAAAAAAICSLGAALFGGFSPVFLILAVGLYMGITAALYPIAVAITNDLMDSHRITAASTALLLSYGLGSCVGPVLSAFSMDFFGPGGLFISNALVLTALVLFLVYGPGRTPKEVPQKTGYYTVSPELALGLQEIDPRNPDFESGEEDSDREETGEPAEDASRASSG